MLLFPFKSAKECYSDPRCPSKQFIEKPPAQEVESMFDFFTYVMCGDLLPGVVETLR